MSIIPLIRPSSAEKWVNCPASAKLEQGYPYFQTESSSEGIYAHAVAEWCLKNEKNNIGLNFKIKPRSLRKHVQSYVDYVKSIAKDKVLYVEYPVSLKSFGIDHHGKIDALCFSPKTMYIIDLKYGKWPVKAINNYQLLMYAYGVFTSKQFVWNDLKSIVLTIFQPRVANSISVWALNKNALLSHIQKIKNAIELVNSNSPPYSPGKHCMFCRAKKDCVNKPKGIEFKTKMTFEDESNA